MSATQGMTAKVSIPVLKAGSRIFELLGCVADNAYNREGFEIAVLDLYGSAYSKSVFRGMAVPTLRNLGFIVGYGDLIRISANGALVHVARQVDLSEGLRALRALLVEMDADIGMLDYLRDAATVTLESLVAEWSERIELSDRRVANRRPARNRAARERILDWVGFLAFAELVYRDKHGVRLDAARAQEAVQDVNPLSPTKAEAFEDLVIGEYRKLVSGQKGVKTLEIEELRRAVVTQAYRRGRAIITEKQFDTLLSRLPPDTSSYTIGFGRSMGADEKLFYHKGKYFQTITIRFTD